MPATPYQIKQARKLLRLTVFELSRNAGVSMSTITRVEAGAGTQKLTRVVLRKVLEEAGAEFTTDGKVVLRPAPYRP